MNSSLKKTVVAVLLFAGACGFFYYQYRSARPLAPDNGGRPGAPSKAEVTKKRQEFVTAMQLTPGQLEKLKEISKKMDPDRGPEGLRDIMKEFGPHLTREQRKTAEQLFKKEVERQQTQAGKVLPPDQFAKFQEKLEKRLEEHAPPEEPAQPEGSENPDSGGAPPK